MKLPIHHIGFSSVNGPGLRYVIWVQGCKLNCKGCFNPETHSIDNSNFVQIEQIVSEINSRSDIEGITISGGEPLDYPSQLMRLLSMINPAMTSIIYTGYTVKEIIKDVNKAKLVKCVDLVLSGRYNQNFDHAYSNKKILNITGRVDYRYFNPKTLIEYSVNQDSVTISGIFKRNNYGIQKKHH
jgi:organic radical activating enzyme